MGLDSVELVMAVEEEFDMTINNADAARCRTPADVIALVARLVSPTGRTRCRSQVAFHRLRRSLGTVLGIPRNTVKLDAPIEHCIPRTGRRQAWDQLRTHVQSRRWPDLERPAWLVATLWALALAAGRRPPRPWTAPGSDVDAAWGERRSLRDTEVDDHDDSPEEDDLDGDDE